MGQDKSYYAGGAGIRHAHPAKALRFVWVLLLAYVPRF
jgi:hypothetical protein